MDNNGLHENQICAPGDKNSQYFLIVGGLREKNTQLKLENTKLKEENSLLHAKLKVVQEEKQMPLIIIYRTK